MVSNIVPSLASPTLSPSSSTSSLPNAPSSTTSNQSALAPPFFLHQELAVGSPATNPTVRLHSQVRRSLPLHIYLFTFTHSAKYSCVAYYFFLTLSTFSLPCTCQKYLYLMIYTIRVFCWYISTPPFSILTIISYLQLFLSFHVYINI